MMIGGFFKVGRSDFSATEMIIYFKANEDELADIPAIDLDILLARLSLSWQYGYHFILVEPETCEWLLQNRTMGALHQAFIRFQLANAASRFGMLKLGIHLKIVAANQQLLFRDGFFEIGYAHFSRSNFSQPCVLLVESVENDGEFYLSLLHSRLRKHPAIAINATPRMGGGTGIVAAFRAEITAHVICACVTDGDYLTDLCGYSHTVRSLADQKDAQTAICEVFCLPCRDIENLLPLDILFSQIALHHLGEEDRRKLLKISKGGRDRPLIRYFDMKHGLRVKALDKDPFTEEKKKWIIREFCLALGEDNLTDIPGFGENILTVFRGNGRAMKAMDGFVTSPDWDLQFGDFLDRIIWYAAADKVLSYA